MKEQKTGALHCSPDPAEMRRRHFRSLSVEEFCLSLRIGGRVPREVCSGPTLESGRVWATFRPNCRLSVRVVLLRRRAAADFRDGGFGQVGGCGCGGVLRLAEADSGPCPVRNERPFGNVLGIFYHPFAQLSKRANDSELAPNVLI
eukprot:COSAG04_NODE_618_length_11896_cov_81.925659_23_plen_146_part_00